MLVTPQGGSPEGSAEFTDKDLQNALLRSLKLIGMLTLVAIPLVWAVGKWQSAALFVGVAQPGDRGCSQI